MKKLRHHFIKTAFQMLVLLPIRKGIKLKCPREKESKNHQLESWGNLINWCKTFYQIFAKAMMIEHIKLIWTQLWTKILRSIKKSTTTHNYKTENTSPKKKCSIKLWIHFKIIPNNPHLQILSNFKIDPHLSNRFSQRKSLPVPRFTKKRAMVFKGPRREWIIEQLYP